MDTYNILHLSDLHIGEEKAIQFNYLLHYLGEKLETNKITVCILLVSNISVFCILYPCLA